MRDEVVVKGEGLKLITARAGSTSTSPPASASPTWASEFPEQRRRSRPAANNVDARSCHPAVSAAAAARQPVHMQCSIMFHPAYLQLIERLLPTMPDPSLDSFFFWNSGSEAVEAAIKLAPVRYREARHHCFQARLSRSDRRQRRRYPLQDDYTHNTGPLMVSA